MIGDRMICLRCKKLFWDIVPDFQGYLIQMCPHCHTYGQYRVYEKHVELLKKEKKTKSKQNSKGCFPGRKMNERILEMNKNGRKEK